MTVRRGGSSRPVSPDRGDRGTAGEVPTEASRKDRRPAARGGDPGATNSARLRQLLSSLQTELEGVYRIEAPLSVTDCLLDSEQWHRHSETDTPEEVLIREHGDSMEVGVYVDESVLAVLSTGAGLTRERLEAHCQALEGVSHFLYLSHRATIDRPVSLLELELQAEIDKFATLLLRFWERGRRDMAGFLCEALFEKVSYRPGLSEEAQSRYARANLLARLYCRFLEAKYVVSGSVEGFFSDIRRMYRLGAGEKLSYAAQGAAF